MFIHILYTNISIFSAPWFVPRGLRAYAHIHVYTYTYIEREREREREREIVYLQHL